MLLNPGLALGHDLSRACDVERPQSTADCSTLPQHTSPGNQSSAIKVEDCAWQGGLKGHKRKRSSVPQRADPADLYANDAPSPRNAPPLLAFSTAWRHASSSPEPDPLPEMTPAGEQRFTGD